MILRFFEHASLKLFIDGSRRKNFSGRHEEVTAEYLQNHEDNAAIVFKRKEK
jgi:hypothetical protein